MEMERKTASSIIDHRLLCLGWEIVTAEDYAARWESADEEEVLYWTFDWDEVLLGGLPTLFDDWEAERMTVSQVEEFDVLLSRLRAIAPHLRKLDLPAPERVSREPDIDASAEMARANANTIDPGLYWLRTEIQSKENLISNKKEVDSRYEFRWNELVMERIPALFQAADSGQMTEMQLEQFDRLLARLQAIAQDLRRLDLNVPDRLFRYGL